MIRDVKQHIKDCCKLLKHIEGEPIILKYVRVGDEFRFGLECEIHIDLLDLLTERARSAGYVHYYPTNPPSSRIWVGKNSNTLMKVIGQGYEPDPSDTALLTQMLVEPDPTTTRGEKCDRLWSWVSRQNEISGDKTGYEAAIKLLLNHVTDQQYGYEAVVALLMVLLTDEQFDIVLRKIDNYCAACLVPDHDICPLVEGCSCCQYSTFVMRGL